MGSVAEGKGSSTKPVLFLAPPGLLSVWSFGICCNCGCSLFLWRQFQPQILSQNPPQKRGSTWNTVFLVSSVLELRAQFAVSQCFERPLKPFLEGQWFLRHASVKVILAYLYLPDQDETVHALMLWISVPVEIPWTNGALNYRAWLWWMMHRGQHFILSRGR